MHAINPNSSLSHDLWGKKNALKPVVHKKNIPFNHNAYLEYNLRIKKANLRAVPHRLSSLNGIKKSDFEKAQHILSHLSLYFDLTSLSDSLKQKLQTDIETLLCREPGRQLIFKICEQIKLKNKKLKFDTGPEYVYKGNTIYLKNNYPSLVGNTQDEITGNIIPNVLPTFIIIGHELIHYLHDLEDSFSFWASCLKDPTSNPHFHSLEEERTIEGPSDLSENKLREAFGLNKRIDHEFFKIILEQKKLDEIIAIIENDPKLINDYDVAQFLFKQLSDKKDYGHLLSEKSALLLLKNKGLALEIMPQKYKENKKFVLEAVKNNGLALKFASQELKEDEEVVLAAVQQNGLAIQYACETLRLNEKIVAEVLQSNSLALQHLHPKFRNDRQRVLEAVQQDGMALQYACDDLRKDREIVLAAVRRNGLALQFASEELKDDPEIVLAAVEQNGMALQYASEELQNNESIALAAIHSRTKAYLFTSNEIQKRERVTLLVAQRLGWDLFSAEPEFRNMEHLALTIIKKYPTSLQVISDKLKNNEKIILAAVERNGMTLQYASKEWQNNEKIVLAAIKQNAQAYQFASEELKKNERIVAAAFSIQII